MQLTRHHLLITLGFLLHLYNNCAYRFLDSFLPNYATREEDTSEFEVGIMFSSFCLVIFLLSPFFGSICQRRGYRTIILTGLCIEGVSLCLLSLSSQLHGPSFIAYLTLLRALEGAGSAATQTGCYALLAAESGDEGEGASTGMGGMEMFGGLGNMVGPIIGAWLSADYGYRTPFIAIGVLGLVTAVATGLALPSKQRIIEEVDLHFIAQNTRPIGAPSTSSTSPSFSYTVPTSDSHPIPALTSSSSRADISTSVRAYVGEDLQAAPSASSPPPVSVLGVLSVPSVVYSQVVAATGLGCISFLSATLEIALERQHPGQLSDVQIGLCFALMSFVQLLFCPIAGYMGDHYPAKLPTMVGLVALCGSLLMLGPSPLLPLGPSIPLQLIALCVVGGGVSLTIIPTFADSIKATAHLGVNSQPVIAGLSAASHSLGEVLGPFLGASLVSVTSFEVACTAISLLCAAVLGSGVFLVSAGVIPWDAGKARLEMIRRGAVDEEVEMVDGHLPGPPPPHRLKRGMRRVKGVVELIAQKVDNRQRRRAGYEKAEVDPHSSPDNSPIHGHRPHPHYSPSDSFILPVEEPPSPTNPLPPTRLNSKPSSSHDEEEVEGGDSEEEERLDVMELDALEDELEDIDVVGEAGSFVEYDLEDDDGEGEEEEERKEGEDDRDGEAAADVELHFNIRPMHDLMAAEVKQREEGEDSSHSAVT